MTAPTSNESVTVSIHPKNFFRWIEYLAEQKGTTLCVGIDPHEDDLKHQWWRMHGNEEYPVDPTTEDGCGSNSKDQAKRMALAEACLSSFCEDMVESTYEHVVCYKPNIAFFEQYAGIGHQCLLDVIRRIHDHGIPVLLDCKRGDIGSTSVAYANAAYDVYDADAVTVSAYMGRDSIEAFMRPNKGIFALCKTSNRGSNDLQTLQVDGKPLYLHLAETLRDTNVGLVVGATDGDALQKVRAQESDAYLLTPGVGAQGATMAETVERVGKRVIVPVSRAISRAADRASACSLLAQEAREALG